MPSYDFQCPCGLRFEKFAKVPDRDKPVSCPDCNAKAKRLMPANIVGVMEFETSGPVPQNTGIESVDYDADRVIGKAAQVGWEFQEKRLAQKRALLRANPGSDPHDLSKLPDGNYRVLPSGAGKQLQALSRAGAAQAPRDNSIVVDPRDKRDPGYGR